MAKDAHRDALVQFIASLDALDELAETIGPTAERLDEMWPRLQGLLDKYTSQLEGDRKGHLAQWAAHLAAQFVLPQLDANADLIVADGHDETDSPRITEEQLVWIREQRDLDVSSLPQDAEFSALAFEYAFEFRRVLSRRSRKTIVLKSLLASAVDALEVLVSQLLVAFFTSHPDAVGAEEKEFSLGDLREIGSIDEAFAASVDRKVDTLMREGMAEWEKYFGRNLKVSFAQIAIDLGGLVEVLQRRNVLIHAQGRVTRQYRRVVGPSSPPVGTTLIVDSNYLLAATDQIRCFGILLTIACWINSRSGDVDDIYTELERVNYGQMQSHRWQVVKRISEVGFETLDVPASRRLVFQFNRWLALKRLGEEFQAEVASFDDSALTLDFKLARLALLGLVDEAVEVARAALTRNELSRKSLREWPVLAELREVDAFRELAFVLSEAPSPPGREAPVLLPPPKRKRKPLPN